MSTTDFSLPGIQFFINENPYSGSYKGMNYKVCPIKADAEKDIDSHIEVKVWYGMLCSDLAEMAATADFPLDRDGLSAVVAWLREQYAAYAEKQK